MNAARGECEAELAGERVRLCLTLGALAEIEAALKAEGFADLAERIRRLSAADLSGVLDALLRGGGVEDATARRLSLAAEPKAAAEAVARAFEAAAG